MAQTRRYGLFVLRCAGPDGYLMNHPRMDGDYDLGGRNLASYDPTHGTTSAGDLYRRQISPEESHY